MAKSKKSESASKPAAKKKAAPKKPAAPAGSPLIDTSLAAENAAKMLAAGFNKPAQVNAPKQESAMFKQLKAGVNKPASGGASGLFGKSQGSDLTKSHPLSKQVGHNQTFGADVNRSGVPRRTPG